jgi:hypothetical protein
MKHVYLLGEKHYVFCALDPYRKEAVIRLLPSSRSAKTALKKAAARFGKDITVVNDNGSENMKDAQAYLALGITHYRTKPKSPQGKAFRRAAYRYASAGMP